VGHNTILLTAESTFRITSICILVLLNLLGIATIVGVINIAFAAPTIRDSNLQIQTVATGLRSPTSMAFIGPNDILVVEKNTGMVKRIKDGRVLSPPLLDVNVATEGERGMLGISVENLRNANGSKLVYVYLYYTESSGNKDGLDDCPNFKSCELGSEPLGNRLSRYEFVNDKLSNPVPLLNLTVTPGSIIHNGGKVVIGPDGNVYTVVGDPYTNIKRLIHRQTMAQNFENGPNPDGTGGVLRITRDGNTVGTGILGSSHPLNKYFAYGIRNSFGIDFDPVTGRLWDTENGPDYGDEINLVEEGSNGGWALIQGMAPAGFNFGSFVRIGGEGNYSNPEFVWNQTVAPTAIEFLNSSILGTQYRNDLFVADVKNGRLYNFNLNSQRNALALSGVLSDKIANTDSELQSVIFAEGFGGITDLKVGPDGYLYLLATQRDAIPKGEGSIYRIAPQILNRSAIP
jgi:aldose sugar dehydrogenase